MLDIANALRVQNNFVEVKMTAGFEFVRCPGMFNPTHTFTMALDVSELIKNKDEKQVIKAMYSIFSQSFVHIVGQRKFNWERVCLPKSMLECKAINFLHCMLMTVHDAALDETKLVNKPSAKDLTDSSYIFPNPLNSTATANAALDVDWRGSHNSNDSSVRLSTQYADWCDSIASDGLSTRCKDTTMLDTIRSKCQHYNNVVVVMHSLVCYTC
jgi:hypothetical protein